MLLSSFGATGSGEVGRGINARRGVKIETCSRYCKRRAAHVYRSGGAAYLAIMKKAWKILIKRRLRKEGAKVTALVGPDHPLPALQSRQTCICCPSPGSRVSCRSQLNPSKSFRRVLITTSTVFTLRFTFSGHSPQPPNFFPVSAVLYQPFE